MNHWLFKTEPDVFSIDDLLKSGESFWDGVRNYQARNYLRDSVQFGDLVLVYHSNAKPVGVAGLGSISETSSPDPTQFDTGSRYFDSKSKKEKPIWFGVKVKFLEKFPKILTLASLKKNPELNDMLVIRKGIMLSIQPVKPNEFEIILQMAKLGIEF